MEGGWDLSIAQFCRYFVTCVDFVFSLFAVHFEYF